MAPTAVALYRAAATGQPLAIQVIQSLAAVSVLHWIGLTEAMARVGRPSQENFKLGGPRCCCTVPGSGHRTGPSGRRAIQVMQSLALVTVPGGIGLSHGSTGAH